MELSTADFEFLRRYVKEACGLHLPDEKKYLLEHRLEPLLTPNGCRDFADLRSRLQLNAGLSLRDEIIAAVATNETSFFRDGHPFETFRRRILPAIASEVFAPLEGKLSRRPNTAGAGSSPASAAASGALNSMMFPVVRIWCAAASTGQEPYTIAMQIADFVDTHASSPSRPGSHGSTAMSSGGPALWASDANFRILATDISPKALAAAMEGKYRLTDVQGKVPPQLLSRFMVGGSREFTVDPRLKRFVQFQRLNLMDRLDGLGKFRVIFCRNVLIYFDETLRRRIVARIYDQLEEGGYLILGSAENLYGIADQFTSEHLGETIVYRKLTKKSP